MTLDEECTLSYYKQITSLNDEHEVYIVQNIENNKIYVMKKLTVYNEKVFRYLKEHPIKNMPHIYEVIKDNDKLILIEEYISGMTLQELLEDKKILKEEYAADIIIQLCSILLELHSINPPIVHRDIKPSNIIISPDGIVKLIDMNAAKWGLSQAGRDTKLIGTVGYAAPEQYGFASSRIQTDIYTVGVLINIMLTGVLPQEKIADGLMGDIVKRCTKIEPKERYDSIKQVKSEITKIQNKYNYSKNGIKCIYAPPGFRKLNPLSMLFSMIGYIIVLWIGLSLDVDIDNVSIVFANKIIFTLILILMVFFFGNYMNVQDKLGVKNIKNIFLRNLMRMFYGFTIMTIGIIILLIVEQFLI